LSEDVRPGGYVQDACRAARGAYSGGGEVRAGAADERALSRARGVFIMYFLPLPLPREQHTLAAVLTFTIIYWLSEAIPIPATAVLSLALCVVLNVPGVGPNAEDAPGDVVFGSFADPTIFLFIGAFIIGLVLIVLLIPVMASLVGFV
jgi:solute carrier family 13 (sodium-dependent dicarboxylate transporter), member 2/3/5